MRAALILAASAAVLLSTACGGFRVNAVRPAIAPGSATETAPVADVQFSIAEKIEGKKRSILEKNQVPAKMAAALHQSFKNAGAAGPEGLTVTCVIEDFRLSGWGASHMHVATTVTDASGAVLKSFGANSVTTRASLNVLAQDIVQKVANGI